MIPLIAGLIAAVPAVSNFIGSLLQPGGAIQGITSTIAKFSGQPAVMKKPFKLVKLKKFSLAKKPGFTTGQKVAIGVGAAAAAGGIGYGVTQLVRYFQKPNIPPVTPPPAADPGNAKLNLADPWWLRAPPGPGGPGKGGEVLPNGIVIPVNPGVVQNVADQIALALATLQPEYTSISQLPGYSKLSGLDYGVVQTLQGTPYNLQGSINGIPLVGSSSNPYDYMG